MPCFKKQTNSLLSTKCQHSFCCLLTVLANTGTNFFFPVFLPLPAVLSNILGFLQAAINHLYNHSSCNLKATPSASQALISAMVSKPTVLPASPLSPLLTNCPFPFAITTLCVCVRACMRACVRVYAHASPNFLVYLCVILCIYFL